MAGDTLTCYTLPAMQNHLTKRDGVYYFRRKILVDLHEHFDRKQIMFSLKTRDPAEARQKAAMHTVLTDAQFVAARNGRQPASEPAPHLDEAMADVFLMGEEWQQEYEANKAYHDAVAAGERVARADNDEALNLSGLPTVDQLAFLREFGGFSKSDQPTPDQAARVMGHSLAPDAVAVSRKDAPATGERSKTLRHVVPSWVARNAPKQNAVGRTEKAIDLFEEAVGVVP